jgi:DNA (cytosine-5)-methyltransferase 1
MTWRMLDLFSGIGGFSLAAQWCWGDDLEIQAFVEIDKFCQKVLKKHWPEVPIIEDITKVEWVVADTAEYGCTGHPERKSGGEEKEGWMCESGTENQRIASNSSRIQPRWEEQRTHGERIRVCLKSPINLLTGGFPCQPFSCAGKRAGTEDDRFLWPEMLRAIQAIKPRWVLAENVSGLLSQQDGLVFERVCTDLEAEEYEVQPVVIPACGVGAPHRSDRVWIVAHSLRQSIRGRSNNLEREKRQDKNRSPLSRKFGETVSGEDRHASHAIWTGTRDICREVSGEGRRTGQDRREGIRQGNRQACSSGIALTDCDASDTQGEQAFPSEPGGLHPESCGKDRDVADTDRKGSQVGEMLRGNLGEERQTPFGNSWQEHWYEVATRLCRVDDGVPRRVDRLKSLGNAIVPQVAFQIMKAIKEVENNENSKD